MYSEYKNITIYQNQFDIEWKNGDYIHMKLDKPFLPMADETDTWESEDGRYGINYRLPWIVIFDRKMKKYVRVFCPRETCALIRKYVVGREIPFELEYCKHLFGKYSKKAISVFFASKVSNEEECDQWLKDFIAPKHSTGTDNQPLAIVFREHGGPWKAAIVKTGRLVEVVHVPVGRSL